MSNGAWKYTKPIGNNIIHVNLQLNDDDAAFMLKQKAMGINYNKTIRDLIQFYRKQTETIG
jgi:hypothetical protein